MPGIFSKYAAQAMSMYGRQSPNVRSAIIGAGAGAAYGATFGDGMVSGAVMGAGVGYGVGYAKGRWGTTSAFMGSMTGRAMSRRAVPYSNSVARSVSSRSVPRGTISRMRTMRGSGTSRFFQQTMNRFSGMLRA